MIPPKIIRLLNTVTDKTLNDEIEWKYDDKNDTVSADLNILSLTIHYSFDYDQEVSIFSIRVKEHGKIYSFNCNQNDDEYPTVDRLYQSAQASEIDIDYDQI